MRQGGVYGAFMTARAGRAMKYRAGDLRAMTIAAVANRVAKQLRFASGVLKSAP
jgi:hypothetical protein